VKAFLDPVDLDLQHVRVIVQGMLRVAHSDGVHVRELVLIRQFYESCRADAEGLADFSDLERTPFDVEVAREVLRTPALKEAFLGSCYLVAYADGAISPGEASVLAVLAQELGMDAQTVNTISERVKDGLLQQVARSANLPALQRIADKL
jgi:tellurite resistance protein